MGLGCYESVIWVHADFLGWLIFVFLSNAASNCVIYFIINDLQMLLINLMIAMSDCFTKNEGVWNEIFSGKIYNMFVAMMLGWVKAFVKNDMAWILRSHSSAAILLTSKKFVVCAFINSLRTPREGSCSSNKKVHYENHYISYRFLFHGRGFIWGR